MNKKVYGFISNIFNSMTVNASRIIITFVLTLVLPKFLGEADYSYWQLYLFYFTYLAYTSLGWCEGTYLNVRRTPRSPALACTASDARR